MDLKTILFANAYAKYCLYVYTLEKFGSGHAVTEKKDAAYKALFGVIASAGLWDEYVDAEKAWESMPWPEWREKYSKVVTP